MLFSGLQILVSEDFPAYRLAEDVPVSPEFREEFNAWASKFFTPKPSIPDGRVFVNQQERKAVMNPRTYAAFKAATPVNRALMQMEARYGSGLLY